jgi:hypothetical protein
MDLGADDLSGTRALLDLGAREIWAVDRNPMPKTDDPRIRTEVNYFHNLTEAHEVILASWIVNWHVNVEHLLSQAEIVVCLSKNTDGIQCGYRQMWEHLCQREVLVYVPDAHNSLTVYGPKQVRREKTGEEIAALDLSRVYLFDEIKEYNQHESTNHRTTSQAGVPTSAY